MKGTPIGSASNASRSIDNCRSLLLLPLLTAVSEWPWQAAAAETHLRPASRSEQR
jgi:hypothetical protein